MILVNRSLVQAPEVLVRKGALELKAYKKHSKGVGKNSFEFKAYKDPEVKEALMKLFHKKCAYCESIMLHVSPADIDHFRPKSRARRKKFKPKYIGYFWLAAEWSNLLPSCIICNRPNTLEVSGSPGSILVGKHDNFPVDDEYERCIRPDPIQFAAEEKVRLLLNPCIDNGNEYFIYDDSIGTEGVILPRPNLRGIKKRKAQMSIETYGLHRVDLVLQRAALQSRINKVVTDIQSNINLLKTKLSGKARAIIENQLVEKFIELDNFTMPTAEYSGMAEQIVKKHLNILKPQLPSSLRI